MARRTGKGSYRGEDDFARLYGPAGYEIFAATESLRRAVGAAEAGTTLILGLGRDSSYVAEDIIVETCGFGVPVTQLCGRISGFLLQPQQLLGADRRERQNQFAASLGSMLGPDGLRLLAEDLHSVAVQLKQSGCRAPGPARTALEEARRRRMRRQRRE